MALNRLSTSPAWNELQKEKIESRELIDKTNAEDLLWYISKALNKLTPIANIFSRPQDKEDLNNVDMISVEARKLLDKTFSGNIAMETYLRSKSELAQIEKTINLA